MNRLQELLDWLRTARLSCLGCGAELSGVEPKMYPHSSGVEGWWVFLECRECGRQNAATHLLEAVRSQEAELEFEPLSELWSSYLLSDGTKLKARPILLRVHTVLDGGKPALSFSFDKMFTVVSPKHLRGPPSETPHTQESLKDHERTQVRILSRNEPWNTYLLKNGVVVKVKLQVIRVKRVESAYDALGNPCYEAVTTLVVEQPQKVKPTV